MNVLAIAVFTMCAVLAAVLIVFTVLIVTYTKSNPEPSSPHDTLLAQITQTLKNTNVPHAVTANTLHDVMYTGHIPLLNGAVRVIASAKHAASLTDIANILQQRGMRVQLEAQSLKIERKGIRATIELSPFISSWLDVLDVPFQSFTVYVPNKTLEVLREHGLEKTHQLRKTFASLPASVQSRRGSGSVCFVTAFIDIQRHKWSHFQRSNATYMSYFATLCHAHVPLIIYVEETNAAEVAHILLKHRRAGVYTKVVSMTPEWLHENIPAFQFVERTNAVMQSSAYQNKLRHRLHHPEHSCAMYNVVMAAKTDFLQHALQYHDADAAAWIDFGYARRGPENLSKTVSQTRPYTLCPAVRTPQVHMFSFHELNVNDWNMHYTLVEAPQRILGNFFVCHRACVMPFARVMRICYDDMLRQNVTDDDQAVFLQAIRRMPSMVQLWKPTGWWQGVEIFGV